MIKGLIKLGSAIAGRIAGKSKIAQKALKTAPEKDLFCRRYWHDAAEEGLLNQSRKTSVEMHGYLNSINHNFIIPGQPELMDNIHWQTGITPRQMISKTDFEFKRLKPLEQKMKVYRSIGYKPEFFSEYKLYEKSRNIKRGDVTMMREYAYATSDQNYARAYLVNNKGIFYEIEVPEGARISRKGDIGRFDEVVFPRSSRFECTGVKDIKDAENDYKLVQLRYLI